MSTSCSNDKKEVNSGPFDHKGLHQLQNCFVADEDLLVKMSYYYNIHNCVDTKISGLILHL